jgi:AcrR family transcriptional regulator
MAARGPYAKGVAKREEILSTALRIIATHGYSGATVKQLAEAVGLSPNGLLRYFGSKDALFIEILRRRDDEALARSAPDQEPHDTADMVAAVARNAEVPGLVQLYARLGNEAAEPDHPAHDYFHERYRAIRAMWSRNLRRLQAEGRLVPTVDPEMLAVAASALVDGLQTQRMYDQELDMPGHLALLLDAFLVPDPAADVPEPAADVPDPAADVPEPSRPAV